MIRGLALAVCTEGSLLEPSEATVTMRAVIVPSRPPAAVEASIPMKPLTPQSADRTSRAADPTSWRDLRVGALVARPLRVVCSGRPVSGAHPEFTLSTWWHDEQGWQVFGGRSWGINRQVRWRRVPVHGSYRRDPKTLGLKVGVHALCDYRLDLQLGVCGLDLQLGGDKWQPMLARLTDAGLTSVSLYDLIRLVG